MAAKMFKNTVTKILKSLGKFESFDSNPNEFYVKIESTGYMPLSIERHGNRVMVAHYFEQNGDLVPDPDVELLIGDDGNWYPLNMTQCTGHFTRCMALDGNGKPPLLYPRATKDVESFLSMWARNLSFQGFASGKVIRERIS